MPGLLGIPSTLQTFSGRGLSCPSIKPLFSQEPTFKLSYPFLILFIKTALPEHILQYYLELSICIFPFRQQILQRYILFIL